MTNVTSVGCPNCHRPLQDVSKEDDRIDLWCSCCGRGYNYEDGKRGLIQVPGMMAGKYEQMKNPNKIFELNEKAQFFISDFIEDIHEKLREIHNKYKFKENRPSQHYEGFCLALRKIEIVLLEMKNKKGDSNV